MRGKGKRQAQGSSARAMRIRWKSIRRWALPAVSLLALAIAMISAVRRGVEARAISDDLGRLSLEEQVVRDRLAAEALRADSLGSRARIRIAAGELGLRPARDHEITFLREVDVATVDGSYVGGDE